MLPLEQQVCSLGLAKRLKELGVRQESLFYWYKGLREPFADWHEQGHVYQDYPNPEILYSAFNTAELGDMLPAWIDTKQNEPFNIFGLETIKRKSRNIQFIVSYECDSIKGKEINNPLARSRACHTYDEKEADARAKMLIYLIENDIVSVEWLWWQHDNNK